MHVNGSEIVGRVPALKYGVGTYCRIGGEDPDIWNTGPIALAFSPLDLTEIHSIQIIIKTKTSIRNSSILRQYDH